MIETYLRQAIRDAVNRSSRKPFSWGGLKGYEQLEAIAEGLRPIQESERENAYLRLLSRRLERVLAKNRTVAEDLKGAHEKLCEIANCLHYPAKPASEESTHPGNDAKVSCQQVAQAIEKLIGAFGVTGRVQRAQIRLLNALKKRWKLYGPELLHCYDIPGLPQDNLQLESWFGCIRRHQRRISGRKSTRELQDFGQAQVLFVASSLEELHEQIQAVPRKAYLVHRERLAKAELPRQFLHRLHHDPLKTIQALVTQHSSPCQALVDCITPASIHHELHTD